MSVLVGHGPAVDSMIGFEPISRATLKLLFDKLDDAIDLESNRWKQADLEWQDLVGGSVGQVDVEHIPPEHLHEGPHTSIIEAGPEAFPAVSAFSYYVQDAPDHPDQLASGNIRLIIETFVCEGPVAENTDTDMSILCHRQIQRTTEAVNRVIMENRTICGTAQPGISGKPRGGVGGQSWIKREEGKRYIWQGSRLEYSLQRHSIF